MYGTDFLGRTCGAKADKTPDVEAYDLREYKFLVYPRLAEDLYDLSLQGDAANPSNLKKFFGVCVKECPNPLNDEGTQLYVHAHLDYAANPNPIDTNANSLGEDVEKESAGSPWRISLNTTDGECTLDVAHARVVLYRCLELTLFNTTAFVRCVDPCVDGQTSNCGSDLDANPFRSCGSSGCSSFIEEELPRCRTVETVLYIRW